MSLLLIDEVKREKAARGALAAVALSSKTSSAEVTSLLSSWAEGEISLDSVLLAVRARYMEATQP